MTAGTQHVTIPLDAAGRAKLAADGTALVSYLTPADEVQALALPLAQAKLTVTAAEVADADGPAEVELRARVLGTTPFPGAATGTVQFQIDGADVGAPVKVDAQGRAELTTAAIDTPRGHTVTARYSGDGDYTPRTRDATPPEAPTARRARRARPGRRVPPARSAPPARRARRATPAREDRRATRCSSRSPARS